MNNYSKNNEVLIIELRIFLIVIIEIIFVLKFKKKKIKYYFKQTNK